MTYKETDSGLLVPDQKNPTLIEPLTRPEYQNLVINDIQLRTVDLTPKDIGNWRNYQAQAKNVYYPNRSPLYDLYQNILDDGHLTGILGKREDGVLNKEIIYQDRNGKKVDGFEELMECEEWDDLLKIIMATPMWGISGVEFIPGRYLEYKEIPRKHIKPKWGLITHDQYGLEGVSYLDKDNFWIMGKPDDCGLLMKCAPYAIYKRGNIADWSQYIEIFGQPVRIIKYDAWDTQTQIELKQVLDEAGSSLAIMIPKQADFELKDGKQSNGDGQLQERFKDAMNQEMSVIILGNTETTTNGKTGTGAKSDVHQEQQLEITKRDMKYTRLKLNNKKFQQILKGYGWPVVDGGRFMFTKEVDLKKVSSMVAVIKTVRESGTPVSDDDVYDITGLSKPEDYDEQKAAMKSRPADPIVDDNDTVEIKETKPPKERKRLQAEKPKNLTDQNLWRRFRIMMADFFDLPRP